MSDRLTAAQIAEIEAKTADERKCARIRGHNDACVTLSCDDADALVRDLRAAREALATSFCPYPLHRSDYTVSACVRNGDCGCDNRAALPEETPNGN